MTRTKSLSELLTELPGLLTWPPPSTGGQVTGVSGDSRQVRPGHLFVARAGDTFDGHVFIHDAIMAGATVVVGERPAAEVNAPLPYLRVRDGRVALAWLSAAWHDFPARRMTMIGVTGTDGKTTTVNLLYHILHAAGLKAGMISTVNAVIGDEAHDTGLHVTTPDAPDVQRYLAQMVAAGTTHAVLETTSHGLAQHRVTACEFDVAVVTNVTHEHLDYHGDWETYFATKARLFEGLTTAARKPALSKLAVLNADDVSFERLQDVGFERLLSYGIGQGGITYPAGTLAPHASAGGTVLPHVTAHDIIYAPDATRFTLHARLPSETGFFSQNPVSIPVATSLVGAYNVSNVLAAATAALGLGVAPEAIQKGVDALRGIPGRMERISDDEQPFLAIVDFAHTPNALRRALETAQTMIGDGGRVITVWGSAGLRDREKRHLMGTVSAQLADITIITAEDPRTESLEAIMAESAAACEAEGRREEVDFWRVADRGQAIRFAVELARPGDVVIVCGKGHEQSMCFGTTEYPWDDREAMRRALREETLDTLPTARPKFSRSRKLM
jgi:UDP-N-acetylmuramoyl-L-alanyl-D-glutamate--2,6-diaminopimelate ligase